MEMMGESSSSFKRLDSSTVVQSNRVTKRDGRDVDGLQKGGVENECKGLLWISGATFQESGRKRLMSHRDDVAGRVVIPESWGQENFLSDWIDHASFDKMLSHQRISSARAALMADTRRSSSSSQRLRIESSC